MCHKRKEKKTKRKRKEADREFRKIRNQKWKYQTSRQNNFQKIAEWTRQDLKGEIEIREWEFSKKLLKNEGAKIIEIWEWKRYTSQNFLTRYAFVIYVGSLYTQIKRVLDSKRYRLRNLLAKQIRLEVFACPCNRVCTIFQGLIGVTVAK